MPVNISSPEHRTRRQIGIPTCLPACSQSHFEFLRRQVLGIAQQVVIRPSAKKETRPPIQPVFKLKTSDSLDIGGTYHLDNFLSPSSACALFFVRG